MEDYQLELFERYYFRRMNATQRADFEEELVANESFKLNYSAFVLAKEAIEAKEANRLRAQMNEWAHEVEPGTMPNKPENKYRRWGLLFALLALILVVYFFWPGSTPSEITQKSNWESFAQVHIRGIERSADDQAAIQNLNQFYLDGNYQGAKEYMAEMDGTLQQNPEVKLIQALLLYQANKFKEAQKAFELLKNERSAPFAVTEAASYFALLSKARLNLCLEDCQSELQRLSNDPNYLYQEQALRLSNKLRRQD